MLSKVEIIKHLSSETGISGITKSKRLLYSSGIREVECKQILNLHSLFVLLISRFKEVMKILTSKGSPHKNCAGIIYILRFIFVLFPLFGHIPHQKPSMLLLYNECIK